MCSKVNGIWKALRKSIFIDQKNTAVLTIPSGSLGIQFEIRDPAISDPTNFGGLVTYEIAGYKRDVAGSNPAKFIFLNSKLPAFLYRR